MSKRITCTAKKDGYAETYCNAMEEAAKPFSKTSVGIMSQSIVNTKTRNGLGVRFVAVRERGHEGVALNVCPFCGGLLHDYVSQEEKEYLRDKYIVLANPNQ